MKHAIVIGNNGSGGVRVEDLSGRAIVRDNEPTPPAQRHYTVGIGGDDDEAYLVGGWYGGEAAKDGPPGTKTCRWSQPKARMALPVLPDTDYDLVIWLLARVADPTNQVSITGGETVALPKAGLQEVRLHIPKTLTTGKQEVEVVFAAKGWVPRLVDKDSTDTRELGFRVFSAEMTAR